VVEIRKNSVPGGIRTPNLLIRSQKLYPVELLPVARDALGGSDMIELFFAICTWTGEKELALQQLDLVTRIPSSLTYCRLKLHPFWDPLSGDPRFEKIAASLAPK
jgi:hypothetical protein